MKVLELFAGIGACSTALKNIGVDTEIVDAVEIDKYAIKSFNAIHGTNFEVQDIKQWDKDIKVDLITHGSPCQDFSLAGKQAGGDIGSGTRSSLMYETIRIVGKLRPKYVLWENVKNILSKKHKHNFDAYIDTMKALGYTSYYKVLNAKDFGIPQNRERVYTVSILGDNNISMPKGTKCDNKIDRKYGLYNQATRWGVYNENGLAPTITASMGMGGGHVPMIDNFEFPPKQELKLKLKDILEENVDEKYYLSEKVIRGRLTTNFSQYKLEENIINNKEIHPTILARYDGSPTLYINNATQKGYLEAKEGDGIDISSRMEYHRGNVQKDSIQTITTSGGNDRGVLLNDLRIRKLTPLECWRLMGQKDEDFYKAQNAGISNTQLYKQAGNSIVVNVLEAIFKELLRG